METINTMAASAARAVWGENKQSTEEPESGRYGDTSKGEPYDAGNMEPISANTGKQAPAEDLSDARENNYTYGKDAEGVPRDTARDDATPRRNVAEDATGDAKFAKNSGTAVDSHGTPDNLSTDRTAESGHGDSSKEQDDTRSPEDPKTNPKSAPTGVNDAQEEGVNEPPELDGPGPKPLAEVAKEHGGDAGNDSSSSVESGNKKEEETSEEAKHESKGTGEKVVHATGLQADGGDFDATKPGAGREADRLMEEKGIRSSQEAGGSGESPGSPTSGKKSLGQKIKDKLHRH